MGQTRAPSPATTDLQAVSQAESSMSGVTRCLICSITWWTFISHLLSMSDGAQKAKGSKQRRKTATFMISILKKTPNFVVHVITFLTIDFNRTFFQNRTKINCNIVPIQCW